MLGTLGFTGSEHWAPFNFPWSSALMINLHFNSDLMIYFLFMTFLKLIAFSGNKVADAFHWSPVLIETPDVV